MPEDLTHPASGGFRSLADGREVRLLAERFGFWAPVAAEAVAAAVAAAQEGNPEGTGFLADLGRRVAVGVAAIAVTLDPQLVVLGGEVGQAGGEALARRVSAEVSRIRPVTPDIVPTAVPDTPVLRGALLAAVDHARADLLASVADS